MPVLRPATAAATATAVAGAAVVGYTLVVRGDMVLDTGLGRRLHPLGPLAVDIAAPPEVVFDVIAEPYVGRLTRAMAEKKYKGEIRFDPSGVSFFEQSGLPGVKPAMFPLVVFIKGGRAARVPYSTYIVVAPECRATYSPNPHPDHWDVNCGGRDNTRAALAEYASMLWNPPLPNPAFRG